VLPLFNHWWSFERNRSLSPFELALAFNSPLVKDVPSNAGAEGVINQIGDVRVKFGAIGSGDSLLAESEANTVETSQFSRNQDGNRGLRLGIGKTENVFTLSRGMNFIA
jgi:hypothetical protein